MVRHRTPGRTRLATGRGRTAKRPQGRLPASLRVLPRPSTPSPHCASTALPGTPQFNATDTSAAHTVAAIRRPCFARGRQAAKSSLRPISAMTARPWGAPTSGVFSRQKISSRFPFSNELALNAHNLIRCFVATADDIYAMLALSSPTEKLSPGILQNASPQYFVAAFECLLVAGFRDSCSWEFRHGSPISGKRV